MTKLTRYGLMLVLCVLSGVTASQDPGHVMVLADDITWGPASPKLPPGAQVAVLVGDPSIPGELYVFRAKLPDGYSVPPHWHPMDENVTVIEGMFTLGFGERVDEAAMRELHDIDQVAYVRFASVYRSFKDISEFMVELEELLKERKALPGRQGGQKHKKGQENRSA